MSRFVTKIDFRKIKINMAETISNSAGKKSSANIFTNTYLPWILIASVNILMAFLLSTQGRLWWCKWDTPLYFATLDAWSKHTSQHFFDPYALTHILHGFLFFWILDILFCKILNKKISFAWILLLAVLTESAWEVLENSSYVIERYREQTASLDYFGDTIANSFGDVLACIAGVFIAYKLKFRRTLVLFILVEIILILTIKDSLIINIIMLIYPLESLKQWQIGGRETALLLSRLF